MKTNVTPGETPEKITVSMIDQDLKNGISKPEMAIKYGIKPWEVDEMFKHPFLKGRRPSKKKPLSFIFEDDTDEALMKKSTQELFDQIDELPDVDPNQVTLEDAITEATQDTQNALNSIKQTNEVIADMLSPTDPNEQPEWSAKTEDGEKIELDQDAQDTLNHALDNMVNEDGQTLREAFQADLKDDEDELEMDDDTFEL